MLYLTLSDNAGQVLGHLSIQRTTARGPVTGVGAASKGVADYAWWLEVPDPEVPGAYKRSLSGVVLAHDRSLGAWALANRVVEQVAVRA